MSQIRRKNPKLRLLPLLMVASLPMHRDKVRGSQEQTRYSSFKKQEVMKSRM